MRQLFEMSPQGAHQIRIHVLHASHLAFQRVIDAVLRMFIGESRRLEREFPYRVFQQLRIGSEILELAKPAPQQVYGNTVLWRSALKILVQLLMKVDR